MKLSDYIADYLVKKQIKFNFYFTGGAIAHVIDSCWAKYQENNNFLRPICFLHEQAGSMAMDAYTRLTGETGVMMVTSGPGATNLLTGIACSYYDSIPGVYITGQVRTWEYGGGSKQRQLGFQETDIVSIVKPVCKFAETVLDPNNIKYALDKAFHICREGRPGPVLLDLPMDIQWAEIDPEKLVGYDKSVFPKGSIPCDPSIFERSKNLLKNSKKPLIIAGGGIRNSQSACELNEFAKRFNIPVAVTFGGKDVFPSNSNLFAGLIGTMGNKAGNLAVNDSDLILALGTRLSWRQIRAKPDKFATNAKIIHVDIDQNEINQKIRADLAVPLDVKTFIQHLNKTLRNGDLFFDNEWSECCCNNLQQFDYAKYSEIQSPHPVKPYYFFQQLSNCMGPDDVVLLDTGQNVMWGMQALRCNGKQRILTSWGHSPMGYSLPASIGIAANLQHTNRNVICVVGDGGLQVNIQELQTIKTYGFNTKIFILNNYSYGAIKDFQDSNLGSRYFATTPGSGYDVPDFISIGKAYGFKTFSVKNNNSVGPTIHDALNAQESVIVDVDLGTKTEVYLDPI